MENSRAAQVIPLSPPPTNGRHFRQYDINLTKRVFNRWYELWAQRKQSGEPYGEAVITFQLHFDGSVSNLYITKSNVGLSPTSICESAVKDSIPFPGWRQEIVSERNVTLSFNYLEHSLDLRMWAGERVYYAFRLLPDSPPSQNIKNP
jgi:hypothetical protein